MSKRDSRRVETLLSKLENAHALTPGGLDWLTIAVDPFHDSPVHSLGYPDTSDIPTIVYKYNQTFNISAPPGVTGNWDVNIYNSPIAASSTGVIAGALSNSYTWSPDGTNPVVLIGGVTSTAVATDSLSWLPYNNGASTTTMVSQPPINNISADPGRIIAGGFEVVNTTPQLYRGGSVIYYTSPASTQPDNISNVSFVPSTLVSPNYEGVTARVFARPPNSSNEAMLYTGSVLTAAECGAYVPIRFEDISNALSAGGGNPFVVSNGADTGVASNNPFLATSGATVNSLQSPNRVIFSNGSYSGAYFTGLSPQSTLQLHSIFYFEQAPTAKLSPNIVPLATPSCPYDPLALHLYSTVIRMVAPGCHVDMNPAGEFFAQVLRVLESALPAVGAALTPVLGPLAIPLAQAGAFAAGAKANQLAPLPANTPKKRNKNKAVVNATVNPQQPSKRALAAQVRMRTK